MTRRRRISGRAGTHRAGALTIAALVIAACGGSGDDAAPAPKSTPRPAPAAIPPSSDPSPAESDTASPSMDDIVNGLFSDRQPVMVSGLVTAGGHRWTIPNTFFFDAQAAGAPSLHTCSAFVTENPLPSLIFSSQAKPDQSAGDYVSFAFDGNIVTGGGFHHASGEEWAWSTSSAALELLPGGVLDRTIGLFWSGDAGENFSSEKDIVKGAAFCTFAPSAYANEVSARSAAEQAEVEAALAWATRPPLPADAEAGVVALAGRSASQDSEHPAGSYEAVVAHYRTHYASEPLAIPVIGPGAVMFAGADSRTFIASDDNGAASVSTTWFEP